MMGMCIDSGNGYSIVVDANGRCGHRYWVWPRDWVRIEAVAIGIE